MKSVLDSRQLLAASVLARTGSFTLAGRQLSLTQSAVSHAIKALEAEIECRLFVRTGRGVVVTEAGRLFLQNAEKILSQMEIGRKLVSPRVSQGWERLRLGVGARARELILPTVLPLFENEYPNKLLVIEPGDHARRLELLDSRLIDLVFTVKPSGRNDLEYVHLFDDELRFIVASAHPWARRGRPTRAGLAGDTLMVVPDFNNTPALLAEHLRRENISVGHSVRVHDHESIRALIKTSLAVGVLPPWLVAAELEEGTMVSLAIGVRPLSRQWGLAYRHDHGLAPMDRRFVELCKDAVPIILHRLQGRVTNTQKKETRFAGENADQSLNTGRLALFLTTLQCVFGGLTSWPEATISWGNVF